MAELDTRMILAAAQPAPINDPLQMMAQAQEIKGRKMQNALAKREMEAADAEAQSSQQLNALFRESGGDLEKMRKNPNLDMNTAMQLDEVSAKRGKSQADAQKAQVETFAKQLEVGSMLLGGAQDQGSYDAALQRMQSLGMDTSKFSPQFDPNTVNGYINQALSIKDKIDLDLRQQSNALSERRADI